jgi:dolichol-phosphate mannosyltransferase
VVLPTLDERENLPRIVPAILAALPAARLLIVDDRSADGTGDLADAMAKEEARVEVMHREGERGLGRAYVHGFQHALGREGWDVLVQMDADGSHDPAYLAGLMGALEEHDLAIGSRYAAGGGIRDWGVHRRVISRGGNFYASAVLGLGIRDLTSGFKAWRRETLATIDLGAVRSVGYLFQVEMTARAVQAGARVLEIPIVFPDRRQGRSKMSLGTFVEAATGCWRLRSP